MQHISTSHSPSGFSLKPCSSNRPGLSRPGLLRYCDAMINITVSVDEEVHRQARIHAAQHGTSVSALVRDYLVSLAAEPG
jgi:hypothetical protein